MGKELILDLLISSDDWLCFQSYYVSKQVLRCHDGALELTRALEWMDFSLVPGLSNKVVILTHPRSEA